MNFYETLKTQLQKIPELINEEGNIKKWVVVHKAQNFDKKLISLLLDNQILKKEFFINIKGILVFNQYHFIQFLEYKNYFNDSHTQYKNKVGLTIAGKHLKQRNEVALVWPYKDCVLEGGQSREKDKKEEIFFNETLAQDEITQLLAPKVLTNAKVFDKDGEHGFSSFHRDAEVNRKRGLPQDTITDNLIVKGNNLLALHSIKKEFVGKVKLIYIDPPYNTGNDGFKYNDNFNHSTWLTFMKNRLEVARELLRDDGVIFVQCDDNEQAYLKVLMDSIFGRESFVNSISIKVSPPNGIKLSHASKKILKEKEFIIVFKKKDITITPQYKVVQKWDNHYSYFIENRNCSIEKWKIKKLSEEIKKLKLEKNINNKNFEKWVLENSQAIFQLVVLPSQIKNSQKYNVEKIQKISGMNDYYAYKGRQVQFLYKSIKNTLEGEKISQLICDFWNDIPFNNLFQEGGVILKRGKKPEKLLQRIMLMVTQSNDIVLDFNLGSGTTAAVAHKIGRQYIGIEQMDYIEDIAVERMKKVIEG